jgi:hypothetical protein
MKTIKFSDFLAKNYEKDQKNEDFYNFLKNLLIIVAILVFGADIINTIVELFR